MTEIKDKEASDQKIKKENITQKVNIATNYCFNCNRCVNVCPLSHLDIFSPRDLINDINFLSIEEAIENNNIWNCLTCGQCTIYCPMTRDKVGVHIPELILDLRKYAKDVDSESNKIQQCETHDGIFSLISEIMVENPHPPNKLGFIDETNLKIANQGKIAYFVGCQPLMEDIIYYLDFDYTDAAKSVIGLLNEVDIHPVVLNEKCCGHDLLWGKGNLDDFIKLAQYNVDLYKAAGVKTILLSCAEGYRTWKYDYPKIIDDFDFDVYYFAEFFLKEGILEKLRFPQEQETVVTYHDACRLGRLGGKMYDAPREFIKKIPGVKLIEMENIKDDANCCGVSTFSCCNEYTRLLRKNRIEEAVKTGAEYLIVPCPKCLTHFNCYLTEPSLDVEKKELKNKLKVIDLATFIGKRLFLI
ncbi:MAG: (Fe-S)-binding protein [Promethearchaeota archaeon]|nr:MAG: (Fe-S)-binding protein [Candidatus Lokiarchaeota archaeon]